MSRMASPRLITLCLFATGVAFVVVLNLLFISTTHEVSRIQQDKLEMRLTSVQMEAVEKINESITSLKSSLDQISKKIDPIGGFVNRMENTSFLQKPSWNFPPLRLDYEVLGPEFTDEPWWEQFESDRTLYVTIYTGLCNAIQSIGSALRIAHRDRFNVKFLITNPSLDGIQWSDMFSFPKIQFEKAFPDGDKSIYSTKSCEKPLLEDLPPPLVFDERNDFYWTRHPDGEGEIGCLRTCCWREPAFPESILWFIRILRPTDSLLHEMDQFKKANDWWSYQWIGVHIRRSDNMDTMRWLVELQTVEELKGRIDVNNADTMLPTSHYADLMKKVKATWPLHQMGVYQAVKPIRFFLASDQGEIKNEFMEQFGNNQVVVYHSDAKPNVSSNIRNMQMAVMDLFMLASCKVIIGTPFSTFSETASHIGGALLLEPDFSYTSN